MFKHLHFFATGLFFSETGIFVEHRGFLKAASAYKCTIDNERGSKQRKQSYNIAYKKIREILFFLSGESVLN